MISAPTFYGANRAGSHGIVWWYCRYCSLGVNYLMVSAAELPWALSGHSAGRGGVIHITWEVIDKVGLNRLLVPYQ
jgi:hypothetical protein